MLIGEATCSSSSAPEPLLASPLVKSLGSLGELELVVVSFEERKVSVFLLLKMLLLMCLAGGRACLCDWFVARDAEVVADESTECGGGGGIVLCRADCEYSWPGSIMGGAEADCGVWSGVSLSLLVCLADVVGSLSIRLQTHDADVDGLIAA